MGWFSDWLDKKRKEAQDRSDRRLKHADPDDKKKPEPTKTPTKPSGGGG